MSTDWVHDIANMHDFYGMTERHAKLDRDKLKGLLRFRLDFLVEELNETNDAFDEKDAEEIVDGLVDLCVVAIGTLDAFGVDAYEAWDRVLKANMAKTPGVKASRPNPWGLPDLIKPDGWTPPSHVDNHGRLDETWLKTAAYGPCEI